LAICYSPRKHKSNYHDTFYCYSDTSHFFIFKLLSIPNQMHDNRETVWVTMGKWMLRLWFSLNLYESSFNLLYKKSICDTFCINEKKKFVRCIFADDCIREFVLVCFFFSSSIWDLISSSINEWILMIGVQHVCICTPCPIYGPFS